MAGSLLLDQVVDFNKAGPNKMEERFRIKYGYPKLHQLNQYIDQFFGSSFIISSLDTNQTTETISDSKTKQIEKLFCRICNHYVDEKSFFVHCSKVHYWSHGCCFTYWTNEEQHKNVCVMARKRCLTAASSSS